MSARRKRRKTPPPHAGRATPRPASPTSRTKAKPTRHAPKPRRLPSVAPTPERRALDAIAWMRRGKSLTKGAKLAHTKPSTVRRHAKQALARLEDGRYTPVFDDRIPRAMWFLTPEGRMPLTVRSSRTATRLAEYWAAVNAYLRQGDASRLARFAREVIRVGKTRYRFLTDLRALRALGSAGEVSFEDLYATTV